MDPIGVVTAPSRAAWRKSSYSGGNGSACVEAAHVPAWRKSSFSNGSGGNCVEVGEAGHAIAVRDSKSPDGPSLLVSPGAWADFTSRVASGRLASIRYGD
jgi:hypothetical protein